MYHALWSLVKPRIVGLLSLTGLCGLLAAGGASVVETVAFVVTGALVAGGSAALNCWYDRDIDPVMERTAGRPLASGDLSSRTALAFASGLLLAGTLVAVPVLPLVTVAYMWLGVVAYVGLYTVLLKRRSRLGVVLGGSAGSFPVLAGWTVVRPVEPVAVLLALLVFVWTPAHAWALAYVYRDDFAAVDVPTVPAVTPPKETARAIWYAAIATAALAVGIAPLVGPTYAAAAVVGSPLFLAAYWQYRRTRSERAAVSAFFTSNCYLAVLFLAWAAGGVTGSWLAPVTVGAVTPFLFVWLWERQPSLRGVEGAPLGLRETVEEVGRWTRRAVVSGVEDA